METTLPQVVRPLDWRDILIPRISLVPPTVRILIVADGSISYTEIGFSLSEVVRVLTETSRPDFPSYVRFAVTKAHRQSEEGEDSGFSDFRFTPGSLDDFDEVWLFGISARSTGAGSVYGSYLSESELKVISAFMDDRDGGVLAMGDHEDLGQGLCGAIPRVRSMRRWWDTDSGAIPPTEKDTPDRVDLTRNDTVTSPNGVFDGAGTESDDTPQKIGIKWYTRTRRLSTFVSAAATYPHPVLCGPRGPIEHFPDHPHEGACEVPTDLSNSFTFDGRTFAEYPGGVSPRLIAEGTNVINRTKSNNTITTARKFGLLCAYDGHDARARVGRVLTDSTWHHWFNVNLVGLKNTGEAQGATDAEKHLWQDIQVFFRNCAIWLAPPAVQLQMRIHAMLSLRFHPAVIEAVERRQISVVKLFSLGTVARNALGQLAPACQRERWYLEPLELVIPELIPEIDPWRFRPKPQPPIDLPELDELATLGLGGQMMALASLRRADLRKLDLSNKKQLAALEQRLLSGAVAAVEAGVQQIQEAAEQARERASVLRDSVRRPRRTKVDFKIVSP